MSCFCKIVGTFEMLHEKWIKNHTGTVCLEVLYAECELQLVKIWKMQWLCSKYILFLKQNKTVFWGEMATNGRMRYFHIGENTSNEQIYALIDDVESADEDDIDNLMNDFDNEFIAEK